MCRTCGRAWARRILVSADEVIVVATPDLANLRNAKNLIDNVKGARLNDAPSRLVLNGVGMLKRPEIAVRGIRQGGRDRSDRDHSPRREAVRRRRPTMGK